MTTDMDAREYLASGDNWTSQIARLALPIVLWVAKQGWTITYKQLAEELHVRHGEEIKRRMTVYGWPAGKIGRVLAMHADESDEAIPPANALIVNATTGLPGHGVNEFVRKFLNRQARRRRLTDNNRNQLTEEVMQSVWDYPDWDKVARHFGFDNLPPVSVLVTSKQDDDPIQLPPLPRQPGGQGESEQHRSLKLWAASHPKFFERFGKFPKGQNEFLLRSGDSLDAYLENKDTCLAIEAKASNAPDSEIFRGIFQCVKYRATLRATQLAAGEPTNAQAVLLTTAQPSSEALRLAKRLRVVILIAPPEAERG